MMNAACRPVPSSNEIIDGKLYLGNLAAARNLEYCAELGITHIVSVTPEAPSTGPNHLSISVEDQEYEDILVHIPKAVEFIERALEEEGAKVLVHCMMGVSRSATIVAAYLMKSREIDVIEALDYIKTRRREIQPNYGFVKQLEAYAKFGYNPKPKSPAYRAWKRRYTQDVAGYLACAGDVVSVIPDRLTVTSDFPEDALQGRWLLQEYGVTHLVAIGGVSDISDAASQVRLIDVPEPAQDDMSWTKSVVPGVCRVIRQVIDGNGRVLVYSKNENRACVMVCAHLMASKRMSSNAALAEIERYIPLFTPSPAFLRHLDVLDTLVLCETTDQQERPVVSVPAGKEKRPSFSMVVPTALSAIQEKAKERLQAATAFQSPQLRLF